MNHLLDCAACRDAGPRPSAWRPRAYTLTGKAAAALAATDRLTPADLFTVEQYDALRQAGYVVAFVPSLAVLVDAGPLLGATT